MLYLLLQNTILEITMTKRKILQDNGTFNTNSHKVLDLQFKTHDFFDPFDLLQVKYEMLRRVHREECSITRATKMFGFSRPAFYQAQESFNQNGLSGLMPHKRGPKHAYKLSAEVIAFIKKLRMINPKITMVATVQDIKKHFGISVHKRSIERALSKYQKKTQ